MNKSKPNLKCRICDNPNLITYLDLGNLPLANNLENTQFYLTSRAGHKNPGRNVVVRRHRGGMIRMIFYQTV